MKLIKKIESFKVWLIIVFGFLFTIGNIIWDKFGLNEWKLMYVPLAIFIFLMLWEIIKPNHKDGIQKLFLTYFLMLAASNVFKQVFYSQTMRQINDYVIGGILTVWLIINLILCRTKRTTGTR